jgi:hypothetical protein
VTDRKKAGQNISNISGICNVINASDGTIDYISFISRTALVPYLYNTPLVIGATTESHRSDVRAARWDILDGTYDYANDPANIIAYFGSYSGSLFFSTSEIEDDSYLNKVKIAANNNSITKEVLAKISFPNNSYKILIFGKNSSGVLIGKYIGYATSKNSFTYWRLDPDDPKFGQGSTMSIP